MRPKIITTLRRLTFSYSLKFQAKMMESGFLISPTKPISGSPLQDLGSKTPTDRPFKVSIEGNIGAGKSTLIKYFENCPNIETYGEPIDWWRNVNGYNLLDLMYSDIDEWLKVFQSYVQLTRLQIQTSKPKNPGTTVQIFERSLQNNRFCFVEVARKSGVLSGPDHALLDKWYEWISQNVDINLDLIVYLRSTPEVVYERMKSRGRPEEMKVSLEYLKNLHEMHEEWLMSSDTGFNGIPILVLDADKTLEEIHEQYRLNKEKILGYEKRKAPVDPQRRKAVKRSLHLE